MIHFQFDIWNFEEIVVLTGKQKWLFGAICALY